MRITWTAFLHPFTAMGVIAVNVVRELSKLGIDVGINVLNPSEYSPTDYPTEIQKAVEKGYREDSINIFFSYPDIYGNVRCRVNVGFTGADSTEWYQTGADKPPAQICNELMDYMLTPSEYSKRIMQNCGVAVPIIVFPHGVDTDIFKPANKTSSGFRFLYIGELSRRKGTFDLVSCFDKFSFVYPEATLVLRANTHMKYYDGQEIERQCQQNKQITVVYENRGQEDIAKYMQNSDVLVHPTRADWFGMPPLEALACGIPVIATASNGYYEFLKDFIVPVNFSLREVGNEHPYLKGKWNVIDREDLLAKMVFAYNNIEKLTQKSREVSERIREEFSWKKVVEKYLVPFLEEVHEKHFKRELVKVAKQDNYRITVGIPTKDRLLELSLLLMSLLNQTYKDFEVIIVNDWFGNIYGNTTLNSIIRMLNENGNTVTIIEGERRGPHIAGQKILDNAKTELILRLDDDVVLQPNFIEELVNAYKELTSKGKNVAAIGPIYLNPHEELRKQVLPQNMTKEEIENYGKVVWDGRNLFLTGWIQINMHPRNELVKVEHLNSGFMYRKSVGKQIGGLRKDLSIVGHREESDFSWRMHKAGYELFVCPTAIAYHFHPMIGGIRETMGKAIEKENWDRDETLFLQTIAGELGAKDQVAVVVLTHGSDHMNLRMLLGDILKFTSHSHELIVVNNDSTPESHSDIVRIEQDVKSRTTNSKFFNLQKEVSVSEARNFGAKQRSEKSKYICFIDDDARILGRFSQEEDWLDFLCRKFNEQPDIAAVAPIYTWFDDLKCDCVSVACMFTSVKVWEVVGGFDPVFGNLKKGTWGYEDVDWSYRAQILGYKLKSVETNAFPFYHGDTTFKPKSELIQAGLIKARELLLAKWSKHDIEKFCRTTYPLTREQLEIRGTKLNLGCYFMHLDNFINVDVNPDCGADLVLDIRDLKKNFQPNSVSLVLASHVIEHFTKEEAKQILRDIYDILLPGGFLIVEVPNCKNLDERLAKGEIDKWTYDIFKDGCPKGVAQKHKAMYEEDSLRELLQSCGFTNLVRNPIVGNKESDCLRIDARK